MQQQEKHSQSMVLGLQHLLAMYSGSILVPMMMMLGYSPEFAQVVYRIGDSTTNAITPIYPYIPIAIAMAKKYDKNFGMGSLISMMLPYSAAFLLGWIVQLVIWVTLNLPIGPGAYVFM